AAKQKKGRLYVDTGDSLISVKGTIFSVNSGTKGTRVSVIEGEVHLDHAGSERILRGGEQGSTSSAIEPIPIKDEVAWSRDATRYVAALASLSALNRELNHVSRPGARNSTHLLDMMPEDTIVYAALPNLTATIAESHRIMQERLNQNAALREWWEKERVRANGPNMDQVIDTIRHFGDYLGEEIAVSVSMDEKGEPGAPLVLAELKNGGGFRQIFEQQISKFEANATSTTGRPQINFLEDPLTTNAVASAPGKKNDVLYVWIQNELFAASPNLTKLQNVARLMQTSGSSGFTSAPFHERIAQVYRDGAGLVVAANLERIIERTRAERSQGTGSQQREEALQKLGVLSVKYFVLNQQEVDKKTQTRAALSFNDPQRGVPSWLAAPGPMGSLEYISPDANIVAGFVVKEPTRLVDDLLGVIETVSPNLRSNLEKLQTDHGINIRADFAAPLGGEFAFAIDGPILPTPSWKMVFEVNDPVHLQQTLERTVAEINKEAAKFSKAGLTLDQSQFEGRPFYTLRSSDFGVELNYTYVSGYMILGPSRAMIERALRSQQAGYSLVRSARFTAGLPADGNANFSAVFYHNLAPLVQPLADRIPGSAGAVTNEQQQAFKNLAANMPPTLAYAYAEGDSITFAANTEGGPFGLSPATLLGMPNALEMQHIIQQGLREK
ncbi:MAG TPA: hypothetical protein VI750_03275, partial [Pyrinomonadaceae bacterium]|nr:hypothetical protein [Pyrinomonadaceae bacterium]